MHISEGVLSAPVLATGAILSLGGLSLGLKKLSTQQMPLAAMLAAAFFVASLVHVPIGPSQAHLVLNGVLGIILGWVSFPMIFVGLVLQAMLFQFGGFTALGVNTFNMALPALICGLCFHRAVQSPQWRFIAGFAAGFFGILLSGIRVAVSLYFSGDELLSVAGLILTAHLPIALVEGLISALLVSYLGKVKPGLLKWSEFDDSN